MPDTDEAAAAAPGVTVASRQQPEYDPLGLRVGPELLNGSIAESLGFDSNPGGLSVGRSSIVGESTGTLQASTDWSRNGLDAELSVDDSRYYDLPTENHTEWTGTLAGYLDLGVDKLSGSYTHLSLNVLPTGIDNQVFGQELVAPVPYSVEDFRASYAARQGAITLVPSVEYATYRFENGRLLSGLGSEPSELATSDNLDDAINSRNVVTGTATLRDELAARRFLVAVLQASNAHFIERGAGRPGRDYDDVQGLVGLDYDVDANLRFRLLAGFDQRLYGNPAFGHPSEPVIETQSVWTPMDLTTLTATVSRRIEDTVSESYNLFTYTSARVQVDHEIQRNVIVKIYGQYQNASYLKPSFRQQQYQAGIDIVYKLNRREALSLNYDFSLQDSATINNYDRSIVALQLRISL